MNENIDRLIKPAVLCFIFLILTVFLLTAIFYDYDEMVYAGEIETIQDFISSVSPLQLSSQTMVFQRRQNPRE